ncbi:MAG: hypothetical protein ACXWZM_07490, partial [Solirubrobacterales bacterium]
LAGARIVSVMRPSDRLRQGLELGRGQRLGTGIGGQAHLLEGRADRLGLGRGEDELEGIAAGLLAAAGAGASPLDYAELLGNDLEPAARSLRPEIGEAISGLHDAGAPLAAVTGSGPTAFGLFGDLATARSAASRLGREDAIVCEGGVPL